ncbi:MAG TPA: cytidylate kinase family protein [Syntrophales bacterium]|nr:cytidylate kinase family protein [Syntrophales bacterium]
MAILSISSEYGTGALEIGHAIERLLGYRYVPLRTFFDEAAQSRPWEHMRDQYADAAPGFWEGSDVLGFLALIQSKILDHAAQDNVIIMARGGSYLLRGIPHALMIRIVAPLEYRIATIMKKEKVNHETARLLVKQADREIDCTVQQAYGRDWDDPEAYEIKFDTSRQGSDEIVEIVKNLLEAKDKLKTPQALELLERRRVAAKIKAKVLTHPEVIQPSLEMDTREDRILIRGVVRTRAARKKIENEAREIAGDIALDFKLDVPTIKQKPV